MAASGTPAAADATAVNSAWPVLVASGAARRERAVFANRLG